MKKAPGHKRRHKSKSRIDVTKANANRISVKSEKLTIAIDNGTTKTRIKDKATGFADFSELVDTIVLLGVGKQTLSIKCRTKHLRGLRYLAKRYQIKLRTIESKATGCVLNAAGLPDNCMDYANHIAGHSDLVGVSVELVTITMESTGTDSHVEDAMRYGLTEKPKRIDYSAGRGQPKATYPTDGKYSANDIDHIDTRNNNKHAGMFAPDIPHTELGD